MPGGATLGRGRLHLELNAGQAGEFFQRLQLALQALLLIAQASRPMAVGDDQQQAAFAP
ncbi:hypothetical protein D3C84_908300 [compost metagenome]